MWIDSVAPSTVDARNDGPLHQQLSSVIRQAIAEGSLPPGSQLPTEADVQARFGVSRSVVRQAMAALANDGLIQRGRGRGSVVAPHHEHHRAVQKMSGLSSQISTPEDVVTTDVLDFERSSDRRAEQALGTSDLIALVRRRSIDGEAIAIIHTWIPRALVPGLEPSDLTNASLHETLGTRYGVPVSAGHRQVRAVAASEILARDLALSPGAPLLVLEGTSCDENGTTIEYFCTWHRADRVVFDVDANSDATEAPLSAQPRSGARAAQTPTGDVATMARDLADQARRLADTLSS
ncbi:GntR family transcriptional regulator [Paramicrobacterium agarici]|uniref:GntR family transcriptional regulator n=1 Tax=Paramicrobacterium agarici TaxID=630514 RepID=UPI001153E0DB|nr:GntR family transcriptional regulator [Microbacterium agarici]TQO23581.1 GntR family transcriptional regulator [Microbacterium agarici]